jgi:hypothetical protein
MNVIERAVADYVFWKNATLADKRRKHWNEHLADGKMSEEFFKSDFNIYFDYVGLNKDLVITEMLARVLDKDA